MKRIFSLILTLVISSSLLVACSNLLKDYKSQVEALEIEDAMVELADLVDDFYENTADESEDDEPDFDAESKEAFFESIKEGEGMVIATDISEQVEAVEALIDEIEVDVDQEDVDQVHESLIEAFDTYQEFSEFLDQAADVQFEMYGVMYDLQIAIDELITTATLNYMSLSSEFQAAFTDEDSVMMELFGMFSDGTLEAMLDSKEIDEALLNMMKASVLAAKESIEAMLAENDSDETMKSSLLVLGDLLVDFADVMIDNKELLTIIADEEGFLESVDQTQKDATEAIDQWLEALDDV